MELNSEDCGIDNRIKNSLDKYFSSISNVVEKSSKPSENKEQLDYFLSKRFLMTAYNNLKNFDPALHDHQDIKERLSVIKEIENAYKRASKNDSELPTLTFEMVFLRSQPEYNEFIKKRDKCNDGIALYTTIINSCGPQLQEKEAELSKLSKKSSFKEALENEVKTLRSRYVDAVEDRAKLDEELRNMEDIKEIYTEKYFDDFVNELSTRSLEFKNLLSKILNFKAYEFDKLIWDKADESKLIREYFNEAGIDGSYSTLTYLKYYINTLDKQKAKDKNSELVKLLKYLESK